MRIFGVEVTNPFKRDKRVRMSFTQKVKFMHKIKAIRKHELKKALAA